MTLHGEFDELVRAGLARWPDVPALFDWLELDRRGTWLLQGEAITHAGAIAFVGRNYTCDDEGRWFVQNGPQRVYCRLQATPWIVELMPGGTFETHTGESFGPVSGFYLDEHGDFYVQANNEIGLLNDRDLLTFIEALEAENSPSDVALNLSSLTASHPSLAANWQGKPQMFRFLPAMQYAAEFGFTPVPEAG